MSCVKRFPSGFYIFKSRTFGNVVHKRSSKRIAYNLFKFVKRKAHFRISVPVFVKKLHAEEKRIVRVECYRNSLVKEFAHRMVCKIFYISLRKDVACRADFKRNLPFGKCLHKVFVKDSRNAMTYALCL